MDFYTFYYCCMTLKLAIIRQLVSLDFYRPQQSFGKVMFLHLSVILFTEGGSACGPGGRHLRWEDNWDPLGRHPRADTPHPLLGQKLPLLGTPRETLPWVDTPCPVHAGIHPLPSACCDTPLCPVHAGIYPLVQCVLGYDQQAGGTHPTRMHSCFVYS